MLKNADANAGLLFRYLAIQALGVGKCDCNSLKSRIVMSSYAISTNAQLLVESYISDEAN